MMMAMLVKPVPLEFEDTLSREEADDDLAVSSALCDKLAT